MYTSQKQSLIGIDIADTGDDTLVLDGIQEVGNSGLVSFHQRDDLLPAVLIPVVCREILAGLGIHGILKQEYSISHVMHPGAGNLYLQLHVLNNTCSFGYLAISFLRQTVCFFNLNS